MKNALLLALALLATTVLRADEPQRMTAEELAKATQLLMDANTRLGDLPLKLELAPDQAVGLKTGEVGALIIPDKRFKFERRDTKDKTARKKKGEIMPVGQLWTSKLSLKDKDVVLANNQLRLVKIDTKDKELELAVFALGLEHTGKREFQLVIYGQGSQPVLRLPLTTEKAKGAGPVTLAARKTGEAAGVLELGLLGRFKAELPVGKQAE